MIRHTQIEEIRDTLQRHGVAYLFIGKTGAILYGYPDTTQDADLFPRKDPDNGRALVAGLREMGFQIDDAQAREIERGKDFVQMRNGPFDVDLVFAPDGIEGFEQAWRRGQLRENCPVCSLDDIIESKRAANRTKDREVLDRLTEFRNYLRDRGLLAGKRLPTRHEGRESQLETTSRTAAPVQQADQAAATRLGTPRSRAKAARATASRNTTRPRERD